MICKNCKIEKNINNFRLRKDTGKRRPVCLKCESEYKKQRYYARHEHNLQIKKCYRNNPLNLEKRKNWERNRRKTDIQHNLKTTLRNRINLAIKRKSGSAVKDLGCSIEFFITHLESLFYSHPKTSEKMTWENKGIRGWHIDHIVPLSSFDLSDPEQFRKACNYKNLQPLWAEDNIRKSNRG